MRAVLALLGFAMLGVGYAEDAALCNGIPGLCALRFDQVVFPTTHNAMSSHEQGYLFPNQGPRLRRQLDDGVRGLMLDLHKDRGKLLFCHGPCALGSQDLVEGLIEIRAFLDENPHEVLAFLMEPSGVNAAEIQGAFDAADIAKYCLPQVVGAPWPTLGELVSTNRRVLVLTDQDTGGVPWLLPMWTLMWDNDWSNWQVEEFDCDCNRGKVENGLFNLNQFISNPLPFPGNAEIANAGDGLYARAMKCWETTGRTPNFITVDNYQIGDLFAVTAKLNAHALKRAGK